MSACKIAREKLARAVDGIGSTAAEKAATGAKALDLLNPITLFRIGIANVVGTGARFLVREPVEVAVDYLLAFGKPERRTVASTWNAQGLQEARRAFTLGVAKVRRHLATGMDPDDAMRAADIPPVEFANPHVRRFFQTAYAVIGSGDKPFFELTQRLSLLQQARALGVREGVTGDALTARADELLRNPTDEMVFRAHEDALKTVYRDKTLLGELAAKPKEFLRRTARTPADANAPAWEQRAQVGKARAAQVGYLAMDRVLTFTATPSSIATAALRDSPAGLAVTLLKQASPALRDRREVVRALTSGGLLASAGLALGYDLAAQGKLTSGELTDTERAQGKQPYSVRIGDDWVPLAWLAPFSVMPLLGATLHRYGQEHPDASAAAMAGRAARELPAMLGEQTYLRGAKEVLEAVTDPDRDVGRVAASIARPPSLLSQASRVLDNTVRDPDGFAERMATQLPGASFLVDPRVAPTGEDLQRNDGSAGARLNQALNPFRPSAAMPDPVLAEMERLGLSFGRVSDRVQYLRETHRRTRQERRQAERETNPALYAALQAAVGAPEYERLSDEDRRRVLRRLLEQHRNAANDRFKAQLRERGASPAPAPESSGLRDLLGQLYRQRTPSGR